MYIHQFFQHTFFLQILDLTASVGIHRSFLFVLSTVRGTCGTMITFGFTFKLLVAFIQIFDCCPVECETQWFGTNVLEEFAASTFRIDD